MNTLTLQLCSEKKLIYWVDLTVTILISLTSFFIKFGRLSLTEQIPHFLEIQIAAVNFNS